MRWYSSTFRTRNWCIGVALVILVFATYWPALDHPFVDLDDKDYVTLNPHISNGITLANVRWALTAFYAGNWHPLTWLSHMLDLELYGLNPWGHHLTNLLLHAGCTLLLFVFLRIATGAVWRSAMVAALFAVHPLHVESVAWVAERKDVLCTFFLLIALTCYCLYALRGSMLAYAASVAAAALALASKPMAVSLPLLLVLLDYWPLHRLGHSQAAPRSGAHSLAAASASRLLLEKIPFVLLSAAACWATFSAQSGGHAVADQLLPLLSRIENALLGYQFYLIKTFWPVNLAVFYPLHLPVPMIPAIVAGLVLLAVTIAVVYWRSRFPYLLTGWCWYVITLGPVIGIVQVGLQAAADRYTYIPLIGIFLLLVWGVGEAAMKLGIPSTVKYCFAGAILLALTVRCFDQVNLWKSDVELFGHAVQVTGENYFAAKIVGNAYQAQFNHAEAIRYLLKALSLHPPTDTYRSSIEADLADSLSATGNTGEAIRYGRSAIDHDPSNTQALFHLGRLLEGRGQIAEAAACYARVLAIETGNVEVHYRLGRILERQGDGEGALKQFLTILDVQPDHAESHNSAGIIYAERGDCATAIKHFAKALQVRPTYLDAQQNLDECRALKRRSPTAAGSTGPVPAGHGHPKAD